MVTSPLHYLGVIHRGRLHGGGRRVKPKANKNVQGGGVFHCKQTSAFSQHVGQEENVTAHTGLQA